MWINDFKDQPILKLSPQEEAIIINRKKKEEENKQKKEDEEEALRIQFEELVKCTKEVYDKEVKPLIRNGKKGTTFKQKRKIIDFLQERGQMIDNSGTLRNIPKAPKQSGGENQEQMIERVIQTSIRKMFAMGGMQPQPPQIL
jgi:hypothetical protein